MSSNPGQNILEFEIVLNVRASEETQQTIKKLEQTRDTVQQVKESTRNAKKQLTTPQFFKNPLAFFNADEFNAQQAEAGKIQDIQMKKETMDFLQKLNSQGLQTLSNFATNPTGATLNALTKVLAGAGADAAMFMSVIGIAVATPIVIDQLIKALSVKGGPLNRDFRIYLDKNIDVGLSRMQVKEREQGRDIVTIAQRFGYGPNNKEWVFNSLFAMDDKRIARIGLSDRAAGVTLS